MRQKINGDYKMHKNQIKNILEENIKQLESNKGIDVEAIHQMRVAIRRLRAAMTTFKKMLPAKAKKIRKKLQKVSYVLGKKRDLDIFITFIHPIVGFNAYIDKQSDRAKNQVLVMFKSKYYAKLMKSLNDLKSTSGKKNLRKFAEKHIWKLNRTVLEIASTLDSKSDDKTLHKLRISVKKLRYVSEFFEPVLGNSNFIEETKRIQDILGDHQDAIKGIFLLSKYGRKFSTDESIKIRKKYELKIRRTRQRFFKIWKGFKGQGKGPCPLFNN